jgi:hypothetical protein
VLELIGWDSLCSFDLNWLGRHCLTKEFERPFCAIEVNRPGAILTTIIRTIHLTKAIGIHKFSPESFIFIWVAS